MYRQVQDSTIKKMYIKTFILLFCQRAIIFNEFYVACSMVEKVKTSINIVTCVCIEKFYHPRNLWTLKAPPEGKLEQTTNGK